MDDERVEQEIRTALDALPVPPAPGLRSARAGRVAPRAPRFRVSRPLLLGGVVAATIIATIAGSVVFTPSNLFTPSNPFTPPLAAAATVSLTATATDGAEVLTDTSFTFASNKALDPAQVKQGLRITPTIQFDLHPVGDRLVLVPSAPLNPERLYRFTLTLDRKTYEWSFQTPVKLRVLRTLPGDKMTFVPITTGIEIVLSRDDYEDPAPFLSISPLVSGRIETHRNTIAFVPSSLAPATVYTVTLRKGLRAKTGNSLIADDYSFAFETALTQNDASYFYVDPGPYEVSPNEIPAVRASKSNALDAPLDVRVYKYPDAGAFIAAAVRAYDSLQSWARSTANTLEPVGSLPRIASFTTTPRNPDNSGAVVFPEPLPKGYYLVELENAANSPPKVQARLQVSELSFYATATTTQTLFWVHDVTTGQPARSAHIRIGAIDLAIGADGTAMTPSATLAAAGAGGVYGVVTAAGGKEIVAHIPARLDGLQAMSHLNADLYWRYVYLDRPLYKPQDTVRYWGVALAREHGTPPISEVTVRLEGWGGPQDLAFLHDVAPVRDGAFSGSLTLPNLRPGSYFMSINVGESTLTWAYFDVASYVKPAYSLAVIPERRAVFAGEDVVVRLKTSFFEGTPAPAVPLTVTTGGVSTDLQTDARGEAAFRTKPSSTANPDYLYVEARVNRPEAGGVAGQSLVQVFRSSVNVTPGQTAVGNGRATIPLKLAKVVLDRLNRGDGPESFLGAAVPGATVSVALSRLDWRRKDVGERYDFVNKEVVRLYEYEQVIVPLGSSSLVTDGLGAASYGFAVVGGESYRVRFTAHDDEGRDHTVDSFVYGSDSAQRPAATLETSKSSWKIGETVDVTFQGGRTPVGPVSYLFYTLRYGIGTARVQSEPTFRFPFTEADVPGTTVRAVRFDGRAYESGGYCYGSGRLIAFDPADRKLQVTVKPDRAEYAPGDQVTLAIEAKDHAGQPTQATVNVSAVDEAFFALAPQQVDLLGSLYGQAPATGELSSWNSRPGDPFCGAGGGTGGGARSGFEDVAHFASVRTDASGKATVGFKLPDNLTSWRVTYQAISPKAEATNGTVPVVVRLPFFVDAVAAEAYLATDRPRMLLRSFGAGLKAGERVNFTVKLAGPVTLNTKVTAEAFDTGAIELPALVAGDYTLTVSGEGPRGLQDTLEKRFTVRDSNLRRRVVDYKLLQSGLRVAGAQSGLTTLTFTDYERGAAIQALTRAAGITGSRVEQRLARDFGERWLKEKFSIGGGAAKPVDAALYQGTSGGIAILPYADADPEVSAKLADFASERFDRDALERYFQDLLLDDQASREQVIVALYGLAALDEPVLATLRALAGAGGLSLSERLHLALALATIGDATAARAMFRDIVRERAETVGEAMRIRADGGRDDLISSTALAAAIAAKLGEPEATALLRYTSENRPNEVLTLLEELIAVKATIAHAAPTPVAFTYERGGTATRVELSADENRTLAVRADELAGLSFKDVSGKVGLAISYDAPFRLADQQRHPGFGVAREYEPDGNIVMVRLTMSLDLSTATGTYQIVDVLPSGLRAIERWQYNGDPCGQGPLEVDGQRVTLWAPNGQCSEIHYYARKVTPGDYVAEPAILQHVESGEVWGWSDATRLVLR